MSVRTLSSGSGWAARVAWFLLLLLIGAGLAVWTLSKWPDGARFFGVSPSPPVAIDRRPLAVLPAPAPAAPTAADTAKIAALEARIAKIEGQAAAAAGSAGRADGLLIAFAARRAVDRGVALGYLEPLLVERFGAQHQQAVASIITNARDPVTLGELTTAYEKLGPVLRGAGPDESWWSSFKREVGNVVSIHKADVPSPQPQARYDRAVARLESGEVDAALAETMRLPGAQGADAWVREARRYISVHRALDEVESAALLGGGQAPRPTPTP